MILIKVAHVYKKSCHRPALANTQKTFLQLHLQPAQQELGLITVAVLLIPKRNIIKVLTVACLEQPWF